MSDIVNELDNERNEFNKFFFQKMNFSSDLGIPLYKESKNTNGWINFGSDNLMPEYYLGLLGRSPKHAAIIETKSQLIAGNGFMKDRLSSEALMFIKNPYGECDLGEVASRISYDFEIFGAFALEIIWEKDRESIKSINHIPSHKVRSKVKDPDKPLDDGYFICDDWKKWANKPIIFCPKFSTINRKNTNQILYCKRYVPGRETYGEPGYMAASRWCELEFEISNFHLMAAKNGFTPGRHINFPFGLKDPDSRERFINNLKGEFEGTYNGNAPFITFSDGSTNKVEITTLDSDTTDERFIQLNKEITEGIMTGHRVTSPSLFGVMQEGGIVNKSNTIADLQQFQAQYVTPKQIFIEKIFNKLGSINGVEKIYLSKYELDYDIELSVSDMLAILTAPIPTEQKKQVLISAGYRPAEATVLVESGGVTPAPATPALPASTTPAPPAKPSPTAPNVPVKEQAQEAVVEAPINENIKNMSGRQYQQLMRIIRQFNKGQLTKQAATMLLKASFGLSDEEVNSFLVDDDNEEEDKNKEE